MNRWASRAILSSVCPGPMKRIRSQKKPVVRKTEPFVFFHETYKSLRPPSGAYDRDPPADHRSSGPDRRPGRDRGAAPLRGGGGRYRLPDARLQPPDTVDQRARCHWCPLCHSFQRARAGYLRPPLRRLRPGALEGPQRGAPGLHSRRPGDNSRHSRYS
jgi:hypothetical protein